MNWDLPAMKANLDVYMNKARNDWIPFTLSHPGVKSLRSYRNILETSPQVEVVVEFEGLDSWKEYIGSSTYMRLGGGLGAFWGATPPGPGSGGWGRGGPRPRHRGPETLPQHGFAGVEKVTLE